MQDYLSVSSGSDSFLPIYATTGMDIQEADDVQVHLLLKDTAKESLHEWYQNLDWPKLFSN